MIVHTRIIGFITIFTVKAKPGVRERFYYSNKNIIAMVKTIPCAVYKMSKFMISRSIIWNDWEITGKGGLQ